MTELETLDPVFPEDRELLKKMIIDFILRAGPTSVIGTELTDTSRLIHMFTPPLPVPEVNCVWKSILFLETAEAEVSRIVALHRSKNLPLWWLRESDPQSNFLSAMLELNGFKKDFDAFALGR